MSQLIPGVPGLIADRLHACGAVKFGAFPLKIHRTQPDLPLSPYYFDGRTVGHPKKPGPVPEWLVPMVAAQMLAQYDAEAFDTFEAVAAVPHGATPYAEAIANLLGVPLIRLLKEEHPDGTTMVSGIEVGTLKHAFARALLVEDVVTTAASSAEAVRVLADARIFVTDAVAVVDRQQGGAERLATMNVALRPLFRFEELLGHYRARDVIDAAKYAEALSYHAANR